MSVPKILKSTSAFAPIATISSFDEFRAAMKAMIVTNIPELGGSLGWSEISTAVDGWTIRGGNTRDWIFRPFTHSSSYYIDVRGCDPASSAKTGVNGSHQKLYIQLVVLLIPTQSQQFIFTIIVTAFNTRSVTGQSLLRKRLCISSPKVLAATVPLLLIIVTVG